MPGRMRAQKELGIICVPSSAEKQCIGRTSRVSDRLRQSFGNVLNYTFALSPCMIFCASFN